MEIVTDVREGAITHKDSLGNEGRTEAGDVQVMSAGSGIRHAEYNLEQAPTRIFQIWIMPTPPRRFAGMGSQPCPKGDRSGRFVTLASGFDEDTDALPIRADARVLGATLKAGESVDYALGVQRRAIWSRPPAQASAASSTARPAVAGPRSRPLHQKAAKMAGAGLARAAASRWRVKTGQSARGSMVGSPL